LLIAGAGLAGLIAGHIFPQAQIIERSEGPGAMHQALLRFRSDEVSRVTSIPFTAVSVRKGIFHEGDFRAPSIRLANMYSMKVAGKLLNRSIWGLDPVTRHIAPSDFYERLLAHLGHRITWGQDLSDHLSQLHDPIISTAPMPSLLEAVGIELDVEFRKAPITVSKFRVDGSVFQTIYYPGDSTEVYRASITGDTLIIESMGDVGAEDLEMVVDSFGISQVLEPLGRTSQRFGKIAPIDNKVRKEIIYRLTTQHQVYSVGRFATWRNILLDDVVKDLRVVRSMIEQQDVYEAHKAASR
jgi:hypothetical protein